MANLSGFFNPNAEIPAAPGGALPAGWYKAVIIESELRQNYDKNGEEFSFTYEVIDGAYKGRKFWHTIARTGDSSRVGKGQGEINAIAKATGVESPNDTQDFHYKPHMVRLSFVGAGTVSGSGRAYQKDRNFLNEWRADGDPTAVQTYAAGGMGNAPTGASPPPSAAATPASPSSAAPYARPATGSAPHWAQKPAA
jgi:hypothetical protein